MQVNYRKDFPLLNHTQVNGKRLAYLDNAATTQKPDQVIRAVKDYYEQFNANPHRGAYSLSAKSTDLYEAARERTVAFLHAESAEEIVFTKGATESLNLVAGSFGMDFIREGDEVLVSVAEHHSNLIPWQMTARAKGAELKYLYTDEKGELTLEELDKKITPRTRLIAVTHISNVLGIINPVHEIVRRARAVGAVVVLDITQSVPHVSVDVSALDVDFAAFSGHKMYAPMGIGVLYGKKKHLEAMSPSLYGGGMVEDVSEQMAVFAASPGKFEGGTQNVEGAVGLHAAIDYLSEIGYEKINRIENELTRYGLERLCEIPHVTVYGNENAHDRAGILSFNIEGVHPHDVTTILDADGIAIRAGHHCAHPLMRHMGVNSVCRASLCFYNTREDIDALSESIKGVRRWLLLES